MLLPLLCTILWLPLLGGHQSLEISARSLDALLQDYAFRAFVQKPRTGIPYDGAAPSNLTGVKVSAMRLRSGSLRNRGLNGYKEFQIPSGILEQPYVERLVLVYHNLANWSSFYYPLPGYSYLTPVLGLLAYNASDLSATNLPELDIRAWDNPILIKFPNVKLAPNGNSPKCVYFDLYGMVEFNNVLKGDACSTKQHGHFSIVVESTIAPSLPPGGGPSGGGGGDGKRASSKVEWIVVGAVIGGLVVFGVLGCFFVWVKGCKHGKKMQGMEWAAEWGDALRMAPVGNTKAPAAMGTRTQPVLENDYMP